MTFPRFAPRAVAIFVSTVMAAQAAAEPFMVTQAQENAETRADLLALVKANNTFGLDLHARLRRAPGNTFLSPFSLSTALAMTADRGRGETARQMAGILHFPFGPDRLDPAFASLIRSVRPGAEDAARGNSSTPPMPSGDSGVISSSPSSSPPCGARSGRPSRSWISATQPRTLGVPSTPGPRIRPRGRSRN